MTRLISSFLVAVVALTATRADAQGFDVQVYVQTPDCGDPPGGQVIDYVMRFFRCEAPNPWGHCIGALGRHCGASTPSRSFQEASPCSATVPQVDAVERETGGRAPASIASALARRVELGTFLWVDVAAPEAAPSAVLERGRTIRGSFRVTGAPE